jgi:hypothetical protein
VSNVAGGRAAAGDSFDDEEEGEKLGKSMRAR